MKTVSTGSSGNLLGSPTFSPPEGGFLTGEIIQHDGNTGQARADKTELDVLLSLSSVRRLFTSSCTCGQQGAKRIS